MVLQGFGYWPGSGSYLMPNPAETRLMIHGAVAMGAKGIIYHGLQPGPAWATRYDDYYENLLDGYLVPHESWDSIREIAKDLTAIGPLLTMTDPNPSPDISVKCQKIDFNEAGMEARYAGPAITAHCLFERKGGGRFIVVLNQDPTAYQSASISVPDLSKSKDKLIDLYGMSFINNSQFRVRLAPGDAVIYYLGPKEQAARNLERVYLERYKNEKDLLEIDIDLARKNGLDVSAVLALQDKAKSQASSGKGEQAYHALLAAKDLMGNIIDQDPCLGETLVKMDKLFRIICEAARMFNKNVDVVTGLTTAERHSEKYPAYNENHLGYKEFPPNPHDELLGNAVKDLNSLFRVHAILETKLYAGKAKEVMPGLDGLLEIALGIKHKAMPYLEDKVRELTQKRPPVD